MFLTALRNLTTMQRKPNVPKRRKEITTLRYVIIQKSAELIYLAAEA
jgi:hypothetical protein